MVQRTVIDAPWYDDPDEVIDFARFYFQGAGSILGYPVVKNIIDYFEKPWHWDPEYRDWKSGEET